MAFSLRDNADWTCWNHDISGGPSQPTVPCVDLSSSLLGNVQVPIDDSLEICHRGNQNSCSDSLSLSNSATIDPFTRVVTVEDTTMGEADVAPAANKQAALTLGEEVVPAISDRGFGIALAPSMGGDEVGWDLLLDVLMTLHDDNNNDHQDHNQMAMHEVVRQGYITSIPADPVQKTAHVDDRSPWSHILYPAESSVTMSPQVAPALPVNIVASSKGKKVSNKTPNQRKVKPPKTTAFKELISMLKGKRFKYPMELIQVLIDEVENNKLSFIPREWLDDLKSSFETLPQAQIMLAKAETGKFKVLMKNSLPRVGKNQSEIVKAFRMIYCTCILLAYDWTNNQCKGSGVVATPKFRTIVEPFISGSDLKEQIELLYLSYYYMGIAKNFISLKSCKNVILDLAEFIQFHGHVISRGGSNSSFLKLLISICNYHYGGYHFGQKKNQKDWLDVNFAKLLMTEAK
jgi:hypothetical protein